MAPLRIFVLTVACFTASIASAECEYVKTPPAGVWKRQECRENGKLQSSTNYGPNYIQLNASHYHENGKKSSERVLNAKGKLIYEKKWNKLGVLIKHRQEKDGHMHGKQIGTWTGDDLRPALQFNNYVNGEMDGLQKRMHPNGKTANTEYYKNGQRHGEEKEYFENGKLKQLRSWANDKQHGPERHYYESGKLKREENYKGGVTHGLYASYNEDGKITSQSCAQDGKTIRGLGPCQKSGGKKKDVVTTYHSNGKIKEKYHAKNGEFHGKHMTFYSNGVLAELITYNKGVKEGKYMTQSKEKKDIVYRNYKQGKLDGKEVQFYKPKLVKARAMWKAGDKQRETEYYMNGEKQTERVFGDLVKISEYSDAGKLMNRGTYKVRRSRWSRSDSYVEHGTIEGFYASGKKSYRGEYKDGERTGKYTSWYENGKLDEQREYEDGRLAAKKVYNSDGKLELSEEYFEDGSKKTLTH